MVTRMDRHGKRQGMVGENISYGSHTGKDVLLQLLIDDGVQSRGHRTNIFNEAFKVVGIASGMHKTFGSATVFDYAGGMSH